MKGIILLITIFCIILMLGGCASKVITKIDTDVAKMADTVWQQKDCRAGLAKSLVEVRGASLEVKASVDKLVAAADQESENFKKCYYLGNWFNAIEFAGKDEAGKLLPDILGLIK